MLSDSITYTLTNLQQRTKQATLTLHRSELLYDLANYGYIEGDIMQVQDEHDRHQVQDITQDGNADRITRILNLAFAEIVETLYPYSKQTIDPSTQHDDTLTTPPDYQLQLTLPDDYSHTTLNHLLHLIHEYMVCRAMADWLSITKPAAAETWLAKQQSTLTSIRIAVQMRTRRVRRTMAPF